MKKIHRHFEDELEALSEKVQRLGGLAEEAIRKSVASLLDRDSNLAREVIDGDEEADRLELEIDHVCMEILARHQPIAKDLRFVTTALKITPDLERIADLAANLALRAIELNEEPRLAEVVDIPVMAERARGMLRGALDAFAQGDAQAARRIISLDDELDKWMEHTFRVMVTHMLEKPQNITRCLRHTMAAKNLERMGDQVTNVCEMIVYMVEGRMIRHMGDAGLEQHPT
jgi:phosphate transport system protein